VRRFLFLGLACLAVVASCANKQHQSADSASSQRQRPAAKATEVTISKVTDGDTIHVKIGEQDKTVRLIGIDTPETHKPGVPVECGGKEASANMARLAPIGAKARLTPDPGQDMTDRYGRMLAYVSVNHRTLQLEQVYDGWAEVYVYQGKPFSRVDSFRRAEGVAKRAHRGVWSKCNADFHSAQPEN
jgi:micrococcal nuclease